MDNLLHFGELLYKDSYYLFPHLRLHLLPLWPEDGLFCGAATLSVTRREILNRGGSYIL